MTKFDLITAKDLQAQACASDDPAFISEALKYASDKKAFLDGKGKAMRSRLWERAINAITEHKETLAPANDPKPLTGSKIEPRAKKTNAAGIAHKLGFRQDISGLSKEMQSYLRASYSLKKRQKTIKELEKLKKAYEYWKHYGEHPTGCINPLS